MSKLGFNEKWIRLVIDCITIVSFSVIINKTPTGMIIPQRSLRQRCPLSSYLFLICAEAFSNLLIQAERNKQIRGLKFGHHIFISHLLFADDSLIFFRASLKDCQHLKDIFDNSLQPQDIFSTSKSLAYFSAAMSRKI